MKLKIVNHSGRGDIDKNKQLFYNFYNHAKGEMGFDRDINCLLFISDSENAKNL